MPVRPLAARQVLAYAGRQGRIPRQAVIGGVAAGRGNTDARGGQRDADIDIVAATARAVAVVVVAIALVSAGVAAFAVPVRSEEPTSELQSLMRISNAVFCLNKKK